MSLSEHDTGFNAAVDAAIEEIKSQCELTSDAADSAKEREAIYKVCAQIETRLKRMKIEVPT